MKEKKELGRYHSNKKVKSKIDNLLKKNASNVANSGTMSKKDIGGDSEVQAAWLELQFEIRRLDPLFYNTIKSRNG